MKPEKKDTRKLESAATNKSWPKRLDYYVREGSKTQPVKEDKKNG